MGAMIVEHASHPQFLSNTYLVFDGGGGPAFFVDAGGPVGSLIETAERRALTPTHALLTHHHFDHVCELATLRKRWPGLEVLISPIERDLLQETTGEPGQPGGAGSGKASASEPGAVATGTVQAGESLEFGALQVRPLHTPGHTAGMLSFLVNESGGESAVFTGDTLFKGSVGGVRAPGHGVRGPARLDHGPFDGALTPDTVIYPGHAEATTVAEGVGRQRLHPHLAWRRP